MSKLTAQGEVYRKACAADAPHVQYGRWVCLHCGQAVAMDERQYPTTHQSTVDTQLAALLATLPYGGAR